MTVLKLECELERIRPADLGEFANDAKPVLDIPHMIIGDFQNEQGSFTESSHPTASQFISPSPAANRQSGYGIAQR
ncbi:hypothetical protein [Telmatospirillum siberiense]|uniref:hypothetical protein n=1 Tax=Telmatospirillum siberiense TaxID=382514 RepID=UPI001F535BA9|nr:hypothetical protein [Telmatospirillum siberiense]